jgi:hypothetical protein
MNVEKLGEIPQKVIELLGLDIPVGTAVYIGETNRQHMLFQHRKEYVKYCNKLSVIISDPDYVGINDIDNSIEFIKTFKNNIKLAVRIANDGEYYARSLYEVGRSRVENSVKQGQLKKVLTNEK